MSATLTWQSSGLGAKSGTTAAAFFADFRALVNSKAGDANFKWQEASYSIAGNPYYIVLKRKDGSAGRILLAMYTGSPAGNNSAVLEAAPTNNAIQIAWFPNGNVDTPSNLTASSGTILGNDTDCTKFHTGAAFTSIYSTSYAPYYFESDEAFWLFTGHTGTIGNYLVFAAGYILVDGSDNAVGAVTAGQTTYFTNFPTPSSPFWTWISGDVNAGQGTTVAFRTNYGSADRLYYQAFAPSAAYLNNTAGGTTDPMVNVSNSSVSFMPCPLLAGFSPATSTVVKNEGLVLKIRQMGWGPQSRGSFDTYSTTGPVIKAMSGLVSYTASATCWFTNFKL